MHSSARVLSLGVCVYVCENCVILYASTGHRSRGRLCPRRASVRHAAWLRLCRAPTKVHCGGVVAIARRELVKAGRWNYDDDERIARGLEIRRARNELAAATEADWVTKHAAVLER